MFLDELGRTFENEWTKHHQTRLCNMEAQTRSMSISTMVGKMMPVLFPDLIFFVRKVSTKCTTKMYGTPFIVVSPDGSLRWSADGLVCIHTNPLLSLEIKCLFHLHKVFQCILKFQSGISRSVRYVEHMVPQSEGHLLLCWSPKNGYSKMLRIIPA